MTEEQADQSSAQTSTGLASLTSSSTLTQAARVFELYMVNEGFSTHTIKAFRGDLRLLGNYLGHDRAIGQFSTNDLNKFLHWLQQERGVPCNLKSYSRRVTTLKVFFKWLHKGGLLPEDPAAPVIQHSVETPLSEVLTEQEMAQAFAVTQAMWAAEKPDPRPHLLLKLVLETAIKKAECMSIRLNHIRRDGPGGPVLEIRYDDPRKQTKERRIPISTEVLSVLDDYIQVYQPGDVLFPCTPRNLEYVLTDVAEQAEVKKGLSFEVLRWTAAAWDYVKGMDDAHLRQKLGISNVTWQSTGKKIKTLAENLSAQ